MKPRTCNRCHVVIDGLDFDGRCEDCFADDQVRVTTAVRRSVSEQAAMIPLFDPLERRPSCGKYFDAYR